MSLVQLIGSVAALFIGLGMLVFFKNKSVEKFNFSLFTAASFIMAAISLGLIFIGYDWYTNLADKGEEIMNGLVVIALGAIVGLILVFSNYSKTNLIYAAGGLLTQFLIMGALYYLFIAARMFLATA